MLLDEAVILTQLQPLFCVRSIRALLGQLISIARFLIPSFPLSKLFGSCLSVWNGADNAAVDFYERGNNEALSGGRETPI